MEFKLKLYKNMCIDNLKKKHYIDSFSMFIFGLPQTWRDESNSSVTGERCDFSNFLWRFMCRVYSSGNSLTNHKGTLCGVIEWLSFVKWNEDVNFECQLKCKVIAISIYFKWHFLKGFCAVWLKWKVCGSKIEISKSVHCKVYDRITLLASTNQIIVVI